MVGKGIWPRPGRVALACRRPGLLVAVVVCLLAAACTSPDSRRSTPTSQRPAGPTQRDYWPTAGWRTAAPAEQGMDPAVLGELDTKVSGSYPQVRSLLIVRHGYLVYERYWHGLDASDGHDSFSVTKSFTSALVGIALRDDISGPGPDRRGAAGRPPPRQRRPAAAPRHRTAVADHDGRAGR